ncbi:MAG: PLP-dependent aminotransferase family protein [Defluviitaleaceae bacterium]|nr:PLP-dependent aminotransferase family protein [Defluviitaleaceae bacterium]
MNDYKYLHIANTIKEKIRSGLYKPGSKIPSIKTLAKEMALNTDTIIRAYHQLESEHWIYAVSKSGYYVVKSINTEEDKPLIIDMLTTSPANEVNPYKDFYHCMEKAISLYEHKLFSYSPAKGMPELISLLTKHMVNYQIFARDQDVFITSGAQQALFILALMDFHNGHNTILVEQPTYSVMMETININKIPVRGIRRTANGIDLSELEKMFSHDKIKFLYLMPRFQNPTGFSYSIKQKKEILRLAKKYHVYIVEDDYLADLEINQKNDPLKSFDVDNIVIYVRSFSKTLLPGLRLGMAILPKQLQEGFIKMKGVMDINSSVFSQGALEIYLRSSMYESHVKRTKAFYKNKMDVLNKECGKNLQGLARCFVPSTGIFAYIETDRITAESLITNLENNGVQACSTNSTYIEDFPRPEGIRLCTCKADILSIVHAVQILKQILSDCNVK